MNKPVKKIYEFADQIRDGVYKDAKEYQSNGVSGIETINYPYAVNILHGLLSNLPDTMENRKWLETVIKSNGWKV